MKKKIIKIGGSQGIILKAEEMVNNGWVIGDVLEFEPKKIKLNENWKSEPATDKQIDVLRKIGVKINEHKEITKGEADQIIRERKKEGKKNVKRRNRQYNNGGENSNRPRNN